MARIKYGDYFYEVFENGYDIFREETGPAWVTQREPYAKLFKYEGTYEENAKLHIDDIATPIPPLPPTETEQLRADLDFLALMNDVVLPSQEGE